MSTSPLISCLCVTEDRPAFMPWLFWNFSRQTYPSLELVIVDSSKTPVDTTGMDNITLITCDHGTTIAGKRNIAMKNCLGEYFCWFDDDDWHAPDSLVVFESLARDYPDAVKWGTSRGSRVSLKTGKWGHKTRIFRGDPGATFTGSIYSTEHCSKILFNKYRKMAEDTFWMRRIVAKYGRDREVAKEIDGQVWWLNHGKNISNPEAKWEDWYDSEFDDLRKWIGSDDWGDTDEQLELLRKRLYENRNT